MMPCLVHKHGDKKKEKRNTLFQLAVDQHRFHKAFIIELYKPL